MFGSFLLHTDDLGETEEVIGANFAKIRINAKTSASSTRARLWRTNVGPLAIDEAEFGYDMSFDMEPPDDVLLCRVRSGVLQDQSAQGQADFGPNKVLACGALDGVPYSGSVHRARYDLISVSRYLLGDVAGNQSIQLTSSAPVSREANQLVLDAIDYVRHGVVANPHAVQQGLLAGALSRYLAAAVLSAFPHTTSESGSGSRTETNPSKLRQAIAFIDDYAHTDISLADIATAADTTPRSLRYMFRRYRDCTPMGYVHRVRLHHAHHDLEVADGTTTTVAEVAHRWGFVDVDRFTLDYLDAYGHLPRAILRDDAGGG
jgi:AraC-like DNA-binding protein